VKSRQVNIIKRRKTKEFVTLDNRLVRDRRLKLDEHGLLHYLLSLPDDWEISREQIAKYWDIGRDKLTRMFRRLQQCGWVQLERVHAKDGTFLGVRWIVTDEPSAEIPEAALDRETDVAADEAAPEPTTGNVLPVEVPPAEDEGRDTPAFAETPLTASPAKPAHDVHDLVDGAEGDRKSSRQVGDLNDGDKPDAGYDHGPPFPAHGSTVARVTHTPEKAVHGLYIESTKTDLEENRFPQKPIAAAEARGSPIVGKPALELAEQLLVIAGHDRKFWPPGWCGAPMRVQTWLNTGWPAEIIVAAVRGVVARNTGPPAKSVQYFENAIADEIARQNRPVPEASNVQAAGDRSTVSQSSRGRGGGYAQIRAAIRARQSSS
jgi:hypothetical protein